MGEPVEQPRTERGRKNRFPRAFRVLRTGHFQRAYRQGSRARGSLLVVVAVGNELPYTRLGVSVGRAIWRDAVGRNRVKRIFREAFRTARTELPAGFDLILIPAQPKLAPELEATRSELVVLAHKAARRWREKPRTEARPESRERRS